MIQWSATLPRIYFGWYIVGIAFFSLFLSAGTGTTFSVLIPTMSQDLGWSFSALVLANGIGTFVGSLTGPFMGRIVDRQGARLVLTGCVLITGISSILCGFVQEPWQLYAAYGLASGISRSTMMNVGPSAMIANWFLRKRAKASGFASIGPPVCSMVFPGATALALSLFGWREAWVLLGVMTVLVFTPPFGIIIRHRPENLGLRIDGDDAGVLDPAQPRPRNAMPSQWRDWTLHQALHHRQFWLLAASMAIIGLMPQTVFLLLFTTFRSQGISEAVAAGTLTVLGLGQVVSRLAFWTPLITRLGSVRYAIFLWGGMLIVGSVLLSFTQGEIMAYAVSAFLGVALGGNLVVQLIVWPEYFGRSSVGAIAGTAHLFMGLGAALGPQLTAGIADISGSYALSYLVLAAWVALGVILQLPVGKPMPAPTASAAA